MFETFKKKSFGERLKDTGYLIKHSFTVIGKDEDIKKPTIKLAIFSSIMTTLFFLSILSFFLGGFFIAFGVLVLLFLIFILFPFKYFYDMRQKADQSWIVYNTISGKDISLADAHDHTKKFKSQLRFLSFVDFLMAFARGRSHGKKGVGAIIMSIFLAFLREVWDLLENYMVPAVVIEQKSLKEVIPKIKSLKHNVPASLAGVFGIDFVGKVIGSLFGILYLVALLLSLVVGYLISLATNVTMVTIAGFSFSWVPVILMLYVIFLVGGVYGRIVESIKVIYFTIFYTAINRPMDIDKSMREELTHYLLMDNSASISVEVKKTPSQEKKEKYLVELKGYVKNSLSNGKSEKEVKGFLKSKGYPIKDINSAFGMLKK